MTVRILDLEPESYEPHRVHSGERIWPESNCAADLLIEVLHAMGLEPTAAMGFTLSSSFDGEQWRMFKFAPDDLRRLFGIDVYEVNLWRALPVHIEEHVALGRMLTVDVDAWWLPDTAGLTYRSAHQKTTIAVQMIDRTGHRLGYFHNGGYFELEKEDFAQLTGDGKDAESGVPPYAEAIDFGTDGQRQLLAPTNDIDLVAIARDLAREHLARRSTANPVEEMRVRMDKDLPWLVEAGLDAFHRYAFGTVRQCGSNAELAAEYVRWLAQGDTTATAAVEAFSEVATRAKALEFVMARAMRGKRVDLAETMAEMENCWEHAVAATATLLDV